MVPSLIRALWLKSFILDMMTFCDFQICQLSLGVPFESDGLLCVLMRFLFKICWHTCTESCPIQPAHSVRQNQILELILRLFQSALGLLNNRYSHEPLFPRGMWDYSMRLKGHTHGYPKGL